VEVVVVVPSFAFQTDLVAFKRVYALFYTSLHLEMLELIGKHC